MPVLMREDNTDGGGPQVFAENIQSLQFRYTLKDGSEMDSPAAPADIRVIGVNVRAKTNMKDPDYKDGDGCRTWQIVSNIQPRNIALSQ